MIGSDGTAVTKSGPLGTYLDVRSYGCFPNVIEKYVKERKWITLQEAIRKMTSFPAQRLGLRDRGLLNEGMWSDVVVFNLEKIKSKATYTPFKPKQYPEGIEWVLINGQISVENGEYKGVLAGNVLRHNYSLALFGD